ncbi:MAG: hypothetical protein AVDCRST_MAG96-47, partial [uncultured Segetibacter sp.]
DHKSGEVTAGKECDPQKWNSKCGRATGSKEECCSAGLAHCLL